MSGGPRVKLMNNADSEVRSVLGPAGNKSRSVELRKPVEKPVKNNKPETEESKGKKFEGADVLHESRSPVAVSKKCGAVTSILKQQQDHRTLLMRPNLSLNASCSSDASTDSSQSRASTGKLSRGSVTPRGGRRKQCSPKVVKSEKVGKVVGEVESLSPGSNPGDGLVVKKKCAWVTPNTDPSYAAFHDEEWGVPVHDDKKLFELLSLCTALAELSWPAILSKRHMFREVFQNFDPVAVSKLNEKKIAPPGSPASTLLSEVKLRAVIENARQTCKIIDELGSFDKYIWGFVNNRPIVSQFRYARQVPLKTSKAEGISKDLVKRGFRGVGPTVVYSFMQVAGITNDHLISCFRFHDCVAASDGTDKYDGLATKSEVKNQVKDETEMGLISAIDDFNLST
ncbi:putative GMP synthase [Capsicum galapagoense]